MNLYATVSSLWARDHVYFSPFREGLSYHRQCGKRLLRLDRNGLPRTLKKQKQRKISGSLSYHLLLYSISLAEFLTFLSFTCISSLDPIPQRTKLTSSHLNWWHAGLGPWSVHAHLTNPNATKKVRLQKLPQIAKESSQHHSMVTFCTSA